MPKLGKKVGFWRVKVKGQLYLQAVVSMAKPPG
jgi:hypothetical protein